MSRSVEVAEDKKYNMDHKERDDAVVIEMGECESKIDDGKKYNMDHDERGVALVINMWKYEEGGNKLKDREKKSINDVENLRKTLVQLGFEFQRRDNLTAEALKQEIQKQAERVHSNSDCFLCVVMSHGNDQDKFYSSDKKEISYEDIMEPIKLCETLKKKPKLFFFQTCRGGGDMRKPYNFKPPETPKTIQKPPSANDYNLDCLVFYSTFQKCLSWSNYLEQGTIFIKSVCETFDEEAYKDLPKNPPLSQMITSIIYRVQKEKFQLAAPENTLPKEVYFTPKDVSAFSIIYLF